MRRESCHLFLDCSHTFRLQTQTPAHFPFILLYLGNEMPGNHSLGLLLLSSLVHDFLHTCTIQGACLRSIPIPPTSLKKQIRRDLIRKISFRPSPHGALCIVLVWYIHTSGPSPLRLPFVYKFQPLTSLCKLPLSNPPPNQLTSFEFHLESFRSLFFFLQMYLN